MVCHDQMMCLGSTLYAGRRVSEVSRSGRTVSPRQHTWRVLINHCRSAPISVVREWNVNCMPVSYTIHSLAFHFIILKLYLTVFKPIWRLRDRNDHIGGIKEISPNNLVVVKAVKGMTQKLFVSKLGYTWIQWVKVGKQTFIVNSVSLYKIHSIRLS